MKIVSKLKVFIVLSLCITNNNNNNNNIIIFIQVSLFSNAHLLLSIKDLFT